MNVATKAERKVASFETARSMPPPVGPDGQLVYESSVGNDSQLNLDGKAITKNEVVFPFRPSWVSKNEFFYTADGKIKRRTLGGAREECSLHGDSGDHAAPQHLCPQQARFRRPGAAPGSGHRCGR